jgi:hypothetical protein
MFICRILFQICFMVACAYISSVLGG